MLGVRRPAQYGHGQWRGSPRREDLTRGRRRSSCDARLMTQPRRILPGRSWMITRRATRRHFLFRPDEDGTSQRLYWYADGLASWPSSLGFFETGATRSRKSCRRTSQRGTHGYAAASCPPFSGCALSPARRGTIPPIRPYCSWQPRKMTSEWASQLMLRCHRPWSMRRSLCRSHRVLRSATLPSRAAMRALASTGTSVAKMPWSQSPAEGEIAARFRSGAPMNLDVTSTRRIACSAGDQPRELVDTSRFGHPSSTRRGNASGVSAPKRSCGRQCDHCHLLAVRRSLPR